ncbi:MAG: hypothetical protein AAF491_12090 [Verrucomicrobiota bacterium]
MAILAMYLQGDSYTDEFRPFLLLPEFPQGIHRQDADATVRNSVNPMIPF